MIGYIIKRLIQVIPTLLVISAMVFLIMYLLPGDPAMLLLDGQSATSKEHIERLREEMGLNDPIFVQYGRFLAGAVTGDLGNSARFRRPVMDVVLERVGVLKGGQRMDIHNTVYAVVLVLHSKEVLHGPQIVAKMLPSRWTETRKDALCHVIAVQV